MGRLRKIAFYLMIPVVIICMIEGAVYYRALGLTAIEGFLCSLDNTIKLFIARPTIQPYQAFKTMNETYTQFDKVITHIYSIVVFMAPILMTTAVIAGFSAYIFDFVNSIKICFKDKMYIIGDGQMTKVIASKYSKNLYVHYLMPSNTKNEERVPLLKEKVKAYPTDYKHMESACKIEKIEKASYVVLNFKDWFASYKTVTDVVEYLIKNHEDGSLPVYIVDAPGSLYYAFDNMYRGFCQKYGVSYSVLKFTYLNVNDTNAHTFFKDPQMTKQPDDRHHIVFVGAGGYGRAMLKELIAYMRINGLTGTVDIFDRTIETSINNLMYSASSLNNAEMFSEAKTANNAVMSSYVLTDAGHIRLNFYKVSIGELKATEFLSEILRNEIATEFFCCIENVQTSFECFRMIQGYGEVFNDTKLYFRVGPSFEKSFEAMKFNSPMLEFLPDSFPDIELLDGDDKAES